MSTSAVLSRDNCDTVEGLTEMVKTLAGLNEAITQRRALRKLGCKLHNFVILGKWLLDSYAQVWGFCGESNSVPLRVLIPNIPTVMSQGDFENYFFSKQSEGFFNGLDYSWGMSSYIPSVRVVCHFCGKPWTIRNCHDYVTHQRSEDFPAEDFLGVSVEEFINYFHTKSDAVYIFEYPNIYIKNPKWVDLSLDDSGCPVNKTGYIDVDKDYILQVNDSVGAEVLYPYHLSCAVKVKEIAQREKFESLFYQSGFGEFVATSIPNEYQAGSELSGCACCAPWYIFQTPYGKVKIGWRKRVMVINWSDTQVDSESLYKKDVTQGKMWVHAWSYDDALECLSTLYKLLVESSS